MPDMDDMAFDALSPYDAPPTVENAAEDATEKLRGDALNFIDDLRYLQKEFECLVKARCDETAQCPYIEKAIKALVEGYGERPKEARKQLTVAAAGALQPSKGKKP